MVCEATSKGTSVSVFGSMSVNDAGKVYINGSDTESVAPGTLRVMGNLTIPSTITSRSSIILEPKLYSGQLIVEAFTYQGNTEIPVKGTLTVATSNSSSINVGETEDAYFQLDGTGGNGSAIVYTALQGKNKDGSQGEISTIYDLSPIDNRPCVVTINKELAMNWDFIFVNENATMNVKNTLSAGYYYIKNGGTIKIFPKSAENTDTIGRLTGMLIADGGKLLAPANDGYLTLVGPDDSAAYKTSSAHIYMTPDSMEIYSGTVTLGMDFNTASGMTLTLDAGATFTIPAGKTLYVYGPVVNNGTLNGVEGAKLVIEPGVTVSGSAASGLASNSSTTSAVTYTWSGSAWTPATT